MDNQTNEAPPDEGPLQPTHPLGKQPDPSSEGEWDSFDEPHKMLILLKPELCAKDYPFQTLSCKVANCVLSAFQRLTALMGYDQEAENCYYQWTESGSKKIVLKLFDMSVMAKILEEASRKKVIVTQGEGQDEGVIVLGPAPDSSLTATQSLKLF